MMPTTPHELHHLFMDEIDICGCGQPEQAVELVRQILNLAPLYNNENWKKAEQLIGSAGAFHIVLSVLDNARLMEHGGGIGGSWLTEKGEAVRDALNLLAASDPEFEPIVGCEWYEHIPENCKTCHPEEQP